MAEREETLDLESLLHKMDASQALKLRQQLDRALVRKGIEKKREVSFSQIKSLEELEQLEQDRIDTLQIPIQEMSSYIEAPCEPQIDDRRMGDLQRPHKPEMPIRPNEKESFKERQLQMMLEHKKRKDWANSEVYKRDVQIADEPSSSQVGDGSQAASSIQVGDEVLSPNEAEYRSKLMLKRLHGPAQGQGEEDEEIKQEGEQSHDLIWQKALQTEKMLRAELAWHKRLPRDVTKTKSSRNLIKLLLRIKKLYSAKSSAIKILKDLLRMKLSMRGVIPDIATLHKQAHALRATLLEFRQENKVFGPQFMFEDVNLYECFDIIAQTIEVTSNNPQECIRRIRQVLFFTSDIMRESCDTIQVGPLRQNPPIYEESEPSSDSLFGDINIYDCSETIRARSEMLSQSVQSSLSARQESELDATTVQLSIDHRCVDFSINLKKKEFFTGAEDRLLMSNRYEDPEDLYYKPSMRSKNRSSALMSHMNPVIQDLDQESIQTELDAVIESSISNPLGGTNVLETLQKTGKDHLHGTLMISKLLMASQFVDMGNESEDEELQMPPTERLHPEQKVRVMVAVSDQEHEF